MFKRTFQGFTSDPSSVLIGLGASAISELPGVMVQNEKNPGRYRMLIGADQFAGRKGLETTAEDARRGAVNEALLCKGAAWIEPDLLNAARARLEPLPAAGRRTRERGWPRPSRRAPAFTAALAPCVDD